MSEEISLVQKVRNILSGKTIAVEGTIAAGKTKVCKVLEDYLSSEDFPVEIKWENVPKKWLDKYIEDMDANAEEFQTNIYKKRYNDAIEGAKLVQEKGGCCILDRSIILGDEAFMLMNKEVYGRFDDNIIENVRNSVNMDQFPSVELIIYLNVTPDTSIERVAKRGRDGEVTGYSRKYLTDVIEKHNVLVPSVSEKYKVLDLDWNQSYNEIEILSNLLKAIVESYN